MTNNQSITLSGDKEALLFPSCSLIRIIRRESVKWEEERRSFRIKDHFVSFSFLEKRNHLMDGGGSWQNKHQIMIDINFFVSNDIPLKAFMK